MGITVWVLSSLLVGLTALVIIFVFIKYGSKKVHYIWAWFNIIVAIWGFGCVFGGLAQDNYKAIYFWKIALFGGLLVPVGFYHVIAVFGELKRRFVVIAFYFYSLSCYLLTIFNYIGIKVVPTYGSFYYIAPIDYKWKLFILGWLGIIVCGTYELVILIRQSSGYKKSQFQYLFAGYIIGMMGAVIDVLPFFNIATFPIGNFLAWLYCMTVTYAMFRRQLMDIEVIIRKTVVFAGLLASVFAILILPTLIIQEYLLRSATAGGRLLGLSISAAIIIFTMRKIEDFLVNLTDRYLFQKKYDYKKLLKTFTTEVLTVMSLERLVNLTVAKLVDIIKLSSCAVFLIDPRRRDFVNAASYHIEEMKFTMPSAEEVRKLVDAGTKYIIKEESAGLIIPIVFHGEVIGLLSFGKKMSDKSYTDEDTGVLLPLARTLAIAISNAELVEELEKTQAEVAKKDTMATVGTLAAGMAHEIRNPVTTIRIFSEYIPDKIKDAEFRDKYKDMVVKEVDKVDHIIQTLVDFSSEDAPREVESVDIPEVIEGLISVLQLNADISERIKFSKSFSRNLPPIYINKKDFEEILLNVVQNSVHAIKDKGVIAFAASAENGEVKLEISDTGCGMSEETLRHIFSPFYTTKAKGFGLGLFVVKQLVSRNRGTISVESKEGGGTRFTLAFPAI